MSWRNLRGDRRTRASRAERRRPGRRAPAAHSPQVARPEPDTNPSAPAPPQAPAAHEDELGHDQATYSCSCGFVFEAPVSASVDCPHCGAPQAW